VAILDIHRERSEAIGKELGTSAIYAPCDVADLEEVKRAVDDIEKRFGEIAVLVNSAGGSEGLGFVSRPYWEVDVEEREFLLKVNLYGVLNTCYAVLPLMIKRQRGNIVNIASRKGLKGGAGLATYSAAKGGIVTFTHAIAVEAATYGVRVNSVAPGKTLSAWRSPQEAEAEKGGSKIPLGITYPEDVAGVVAFLVSEDARHVTGACIDASGGTALH
jgi:2-hydroxycyclohexanecarboxyl-CoA dehydrogenase